MSTDDLDQHVHAFHRQRDRLAALQRQLTAITAEATAPRKELKVVVGHDGGLTDLTFTDTRFQRLSPERLAELIVTTVAAARKALADKVAECTAGEESQPTPGFDELMDSDPDWEQILTMDPGSSRNEASGE